MARVKLAPALPKDDTRLNGLDTIADRVTNHPKDAVYVVGLIRRSQLVIDDKRGGARQPTVEFVHVEGLNHSGDAAIAQELLERAFKRREGTDPDQMDLSIASGLRTAGGDPDGLPF